MAAFVDKHTGDEYKLVKNNGDLIVPNDQLKNNLNVACDPTLEEKQRWERYEQPDPGREKGHGEINKSTNQ